MSVKQLGCLVDHKTAAQITKISNFIWMLLKAQLSVPIIKRVCHFV